jgi:CarD family transcriptional regulator
LAISSVQRPKESNRDMSLDDQKAKSHRFSETPDAGSVPLNACEGGKSRLEFNATEYIVYPAHGVGQILSIEEQTVAGASLEFFVIFFAKSKMTLRVPVRKAANVGMRKPSDLSAVQGAKQILSETPRKVRGNWSRLAQEYGSKINSGDIVAIAEVARDLFRPGDSGQSFSERQLYVSALDRLCGEIALVNGISEKQAVEELEGLLKTSKLKRSA